MEHTAISCLYYAYVHLTLYTDVFPMIQMLLIYFLLLYKYGRSNSCICKNVVFCMQRYKCNVEMVLSGQMNNIIESHFIHSTDCMHVALANLLFEILMVRGGVLSLPTWFSQ